MTPPNPILWNPSHEFKAASNLNNYLHWLPKHGYPTFDSYEALYAWSVDNIEDFWNSFSQWSGISFDSPPTCILENPTMPGAKWFVGAQLNFAQVLLGYYIEHPEKVAIISIDESGKKTEISGKQLTGQVASVRGFLADAGVVPGDRVAGYLPNTEHAIIAMLATTALGAVWSSCSPDFGAQGVLDRFEQIEPKVLFAIDRYAYNGKNIDCIEKVRTIQSRLTTLVCTVWIGSDPTKRSDPPVSDVQIVWDDVVSRPTALAFESMPFDHPVYILYSSGTTGVPKCIVHGAGGVLLQHLKELRLHTNLTHEDRLMYFTTTGWMMWNWMVSGLAVGATLVLYEGSPSFPTIHRLWDTVRDEKVTIFGTSAKFIGACRIQKLFSSDLPVLPSLKTILSTGSPLLAEDFDWIYESVKKEVWLASISGGTDIVSCFFLGNPLLPVRRGELQCRGLGMAVKAFDDGGKEIFNEPGELVCTKPAPSMPVFFWKDPTGEKYRQAYFEDYPGIWKHGDYAVIFDHGGAMIKGRSDATLNPSGVRIGTAEIYRQVETMEEVQDSLVIGQEWQGDVRIVLFVVLKAESIFSGELSQKIKNKIREGASPRHVPEKIIAITEVPYTRSGKKVELAVTKIIHGKTVDNLEALVNPESLDQFKDLVELKK